MASCTKCNLSMTLVTCRNRTIVNPGVNWEFVNWSQFHWLENQQWHTPCFQSLLTVTVFEKSVKGSLWFPTLNACQTCLPQVQHHHLCHYACPYWGLLQHYYGLSLPYTTPFTDMPEAQITANIALRLDLFCKLAWGSFYMFESN